MKRFSSFVLAGGKSSRMGKEKAFLELGGMTLLQRAVALAATAAEGVCIVGDREKFQAFGRVVEDVFPGCGPLAGIHAALRQTASDLNLILAVDLPFVQPECLRYLASVAEQSKALVTIPRGGGGWQPLCAIYRREFARVAEKSLGDGSYKVDALFAEVQMHVVEEAELVAAGFSGSMFRNLNTPEEFAQAEKEMMARGG